MKVECVKFIVKGIAPSENHANGRARNGRLFPSKEYKAWKKVCEGLKVQRIIDSEFYETERVFHFPLYWKNGNLKKKDTTSYIKYTDDELVKRLITYNDKQIDDCQIRMGSEEKVNCKEGEEYTEWTIWSVGDNE